MSVYEQQLEQEGRSTTSSSSVLLDALYCEEEEKWEEEEEEEEEEAEAVRGGWCVEDNAVLGRKNNKHHHPCLLVPTPQPPPSSSLLPLLLLEQDLFWEDEELLSLFSKEEKQQQQQQQLQSLNLDSSLPGLCLARKEAVEWMLKVNAHYGFSTLTAILSINYLDRFLASLDPRFEQKEATATDSSDKPWMIQLAAVTCLSLAAKVEETYVPLLLDLQVEGTKYLFEAKTIQKMELLVLSTLGWRMNPVTPISFLDHIIRRLGLKTQLHWEFLRRCERLLLSVVADGRFVGYLPSVLAAATMMHVIDQIEASNPLDYQNQLMAVLNISKDKVMDCYSHIGEISSSYSSATNNNNNKRKFEEMMNGPPSSPTGVMDAYFSGESCSSSLSSSPAPAASVLKKSRVHEQHMPLPPSLSRVFVDIVGSSSPR